MKHHSAGVIAVLAAAMLGGSLGPAGAQTPAEIKAAIKCRKTIASQSAALVKAELSAIDKCHKLRDKGKPAPNCNQVAAADTKGKIAAGEGKAAAKIDKACGPADRDGIVLRNYLPAGDVDSKVFPAVRAGVEDSSTDLLGTPGLTGTKAEKPKIKCHAALASERSKIINEVVKGAVKCQTGQDELADAANDFSSIAAACAAPAIATSHGAKIQKACDPAIVADGTQVGSCNPLPGCLVTAAQATGEALASAIFGQPAECGNNVLETGEACDDGDLAPDDGCGVTCQIEGGWQCAGQPSSCNPICGDGLRRGSEACDDGDLARDDGCGATCQIESGWQCAGQPSGCNPICGDGLLRGTEACDDGNLTNGDGCDANCTVPACGNGVVGTGEECDDGNNLNTDGCVGQCQLAECGDGFVETGREQCGDAPPTEPSCTAPSDQTCQVTTCSPPIGERTARVDLVVPAGLSVGILQVTVDYREDKVRIPGTRDDPDTVGQRVTIEPAAQGLGNKIDLDFRLDVTLTPSTALQSGPIFQVRFDVCAVATIDEYACQVTSAFDEAGNVDLTNQVSCTLALL